MLSEAGETLARVQSKLKSSGQYGKMRAMIMEAAVHAIHENNSSSPPHPELFLPSEGLTETLKTDRGKAAMALILDFCEFLNLQYSFSVLRLESNLNENEENQGKLLLKEKKQQHSSSKDSCILLQIVDEWLTHEEGKNKEATESTYSNTDEDGTSEKNVSSIESLSNGEKESSASLSPSSFNSSNPKDPAAEKQTSISNEEIPIPKEEQISDEKEEGRQTASNAVDTTFYVSHWTDRTVTRVDQVAGQQVQLDSLVNCKVRIFDPLDSMTVDNCEGGELIVAACEGSVFLRNCKNMTIHAACKQLRLRDCTNLDIRLFTTTDPVVEMCDHINFRPFHLRLPRLSDNFKIAKLDASLNRFIHVYDFTRDDTSLSTPHFVVHYPQHDLLMESRYDEYGTPTCPHEIEDLLQGRLKPAPSSEAGPNRSHDIKTGGLAWNSVTGNAEVRRESDCFALPPVSELKGVQKESDEKKPPFSSGTVDNRFIFGTGERDSDSTTYSESETNYSRVTSEEESSDEF